MRLIPGFDTNLVVFDWSPDGKSIYTRTSGTPQTSQPVYKVDMVTGKAELWKILGEALGTGVAVGPPYLSSDGTAYAYVFAQLLSQAYPVTGLK
jgi:hypothetical protein